MNMGNEWVYMLWVFQSVTVGRACVCADLASDQLPLPHFPLFFACLVTQRLINSPFALLSHSDLESK